MQNNLILHIPHSSTKIPFMEGYLVNENFLNLEILKLTDWYTDELFHSDKDEMIIAEFSRIFCDPERFSDDSKEVMSQFCMGVLYEKTDEGEVMRIVSPDLRNRIMKEYYWEHHNKFNKAVNEALKQYGSALILDCHSYPSSPLKRDLNQEPNRPDFNIGTDDFHTPYALIELSEAFFKKDGYSLGIDWPYSGSIVPMQHYQKNKNVQSIMLEINRSLYLKEPTSEKSGNFTEIKNLVSEYMDVLRDYLR